MPEKPEKAEDVVRRIAQEEVAKIQFPEVKFPVDEMVDKLGKCVGEHCNRLVEGVTAKLQPKVEDKPLKPVEEGVKGVAGDEIPPKSSTLPAAPEPTKKLTHSELKALGMDYCPFCEDGKAIGKHDLECAKCKTAVTKDMKRCPKCGSKGANIV